MASVHVIYDPHDRITHDGDMNRKLQLRIGRIAVPGRHLGNGARKTLVARLTQMVLDTEGHDD